MSDRIRFYDHLQVLESQDQPMERQQRLQAMARPLLSWYEGHARVLPWRENPEPYRVWISEIMLQQTRVEAVKPYFQRFMEAFPDPASLAEAQDDRLMKLWEGLGYYSRARNLKKAAKMIQEEYGGRLPDSPKELLKLPGIGSYTAGAVASIAYQVPVPAVDGNVLRVISRILADREDIRSPQVKKRMEQELGQVMPREKPGDYNQALIEIGAMVCVPAGEPRCGVCPLESLCLTCRLGLWKEIPFRSPQKKRREEKLTVCLICQGEKVALRRRPEEGLLASLYEFPNCPGVLKADQAARAFGISQEDTAGIVPLESSRHIFSHVEWHMTGYMIRLKDQAQWPSSQEKELMMVDRKTVLERYSIPGAFKAYTKLLSHPFQG